MIYSIKSANMTYTIAKKGAELASAISKEGTSYLWRGAPEIWGKHSPILFPLCGRLKNGEYIYGKKTYKMGAHGFFSSSLPDVIYHDEGKIVFSLSDNEDTREIYPFQFIMTLTYEAKDNTLTVGAEVENTGYNTMPFMFGGHPAIALPMEEGLSFDDYAIDMGCDCGYLTRLSPGMPFTVPNAEKIEFTDGIYPISNEEIVKMDTVIFSGLPGGIRLYSKKGKRQIFLSYSDNLKYLALWKANKPGADYLCLEPWSGIPGDGISDEIFETRASMLRLKPKEKTTLTYSLTFI